MAIHSTKKLAKPPSRTISSESLDQTLENNDTTLRPKSLEDYIGQQEIKKNLAVFMQASKNRSEPLEHVLLHGSPGLGKTTLANIIANEMKTNIRITSGPIMERQGDIAALITNLEPGDILFIDEIHRLKPIIEETLYSVMEDFALDIILGKGPSAKSIRLNLPKFTLIGATTKLSLISSPLRDRFGHTFRLDFYQQNEMEKIIERSAKLLEISIEKEAVKKLAYSSRQTPRIANRLLRRMRDFASVEGLNHLNLSLIEKGLTHLGIDEQGLDGTDRTILRLIIENFRGGPVGLSTLSAATHEEGQTLEDIYEPFLLQKGFLERTPRGRMVTQKGYHHLGLIPPPQDKTQSLLF
ncbi:MAG: Holliday junction DNA helicase RuvB, holliday junction DNA helicase RuvB [Candidatus Peregrinibacteria bacterium GW2011_GWE2_39_6]|nr:MAG: Holliday junction DNA helicase RuvB, holliday junction DNA helicase RuvB [Candidatus Peregrinibacteria bacterium GW2011_GWF2_39_17]KKR26792.1 MAG: Holliday junction DNA helicase RuvB, holliday junction DNA helicase RuvB [Candidatus Peregrinibacteria bacterium GW2011_GWE2_39_6]HCW32862.1 Holliday junction branch migration DNA helicase RuvB [Candidatus Peregrinibacteria bacterium]